MAVILNVLNVRQGGKDLFFEDGTPEEREILVKEIMPMMKKGFALFLIRGERCDQITGYDKKNHEWVLIPDAKATPKLAKKKVSAKGSTVKAVGATAGG